MNGGDFAFANVLHLRGIYPTPQMGLHLARIFAFTFLFEICENRGGIAQGETFCFVPLHTRILLRAERVAFLCCFLAFSKK